MNRRHFILGTTGALAVGALPSLCDDGNASKPVVRFGLVTDAHSADLDSTRPPGEVRAFRESRGKLREFVETMNARAVDFVVELGDFAECAPTRAQRLADLDAIEAEFRRFKGPRYHVLGNHDLQGFTREEFADHVENTGIAKKDAAWYSFVVCGVTFIVLDHGYYPDGTPMVPGRVDWEKGCLAPEEAAWLEKTIDAAPGRVVVFSHWRLDPENGVVTGLQARDAAQTRAVFTKGWTKPSWYPKHPKVIAAFSGHHHDGCFNVLDGIGYYGLRAMCMGGGADNSGYAEVALHADGRVSVTGFRKARTVGW